MKRLICKLVGHKRQYVYYSDWVCCRRCCAEIEHIGRVSGY